MVVQGIGAAEKNGVIAPDHPLRADFVGQPLKGGEDHPVFGGQPRLHLPPVRGEGELEVIGVFPQQVQLVQHGSRVLGPEHNAVHILRPQRDAADAPGRGGIAHQDIALPQPVEKPAGVKGRDVGPAAGAYDHGFVHLGFGVGDRGAKKSFSS